jgi:hypothetical protein
MHRCWRLEARAAVNPPSCLASRGRELCSHQCGCGSAAARVCLLQNCLSRHVISRDGVHSHNRLSLAAASGAADNTSVADDNVATAAASSQLVSCFMGCIQRAG